MGEAGGVVESSKRIESIGIRILEPHCSNKSYIINYANGFDLETP